MKDTIGHKHTVNVEASGVGAVGAVGARAHPTL